MTQKPNKVRKSLRFSFLDGIFASMMTGFTQDYFTPFILIIGGTTRHVGFLNAFPNLVSALVQIKAADISERVRSRRRVINLFVVFQALTLIPIMYVSFAGKCSPSFFIFLVVLFTGLLALAIPPWVSMMTDYLPSNKRGQYFGWRNKVLGVVTIVSSFCAGAILFFMKNVNLFHGFGIIFSVACISRFISWYFLRQQYDPPLKYKSDNYFSFFDFIRGAKEKHVSRFIFVVAAMSFAANVSAPFFSVFMLREMKMNYMLYTSITVTATLTIFLMNEIWGRHADKYGSVRIIKFCAPLVALVPLLWVPCHNIIYLFIVQVYSGFAWAGFNLCGLNYVFDAVTPEKRTRAVSYFNVINGFALFLGALLGGCILAGVSPVFGSKLFSLFIISSLLRLSVAVFMAPKLKEVRTVKHVENGDLFYSVIGLSTLIDKKQ